MCSRSVGGHESRQRMDGLASWVDVCPGRRDLVADGPDQTHSRLRLRLDPPRCFVPTTTNIKQLSRSLQTLHSGPPLLVLPNFRLNVYISSSPAKPHCCVAHAWGPISFALQPIKSCCVHDFAPFSLATLAVCTLVDGNSLCLSVYNGVMTLLSLRWIRAVNKS